MLRKIADITASPDVQPRVALHYPTVEKYRSAIDREEDLDPLRVLFDGKTHWLHEGFHRLEAYKLAGYTEVPVDVAKGTKLDAILAAASSNYKHGLPRTNDDIERAILMTIGVNTERGVDWTQTEIAKHCHCDQSTVSRILARHAEHKSPSRAEKRALVEQALAEDPKASAREIERKTGVHHSTVEKVRKGRAGAEVAEQPSVADNEPTRTLPERAQAPAPVAPGIDRGPAASARPRRVDGVLVPAADDPALYSRDGYSRTEARQIDANIMRDLDVAVSGMSEADWDRLMRRVDMKRLERRN
jgi:hypothetical protein